MSLQIGIVGLPNVGKSTLFNALTDAQNAEAANYPFCTIEPNKAVVTVPDERLDKLAKLVGVKRVIHATIEFVDVAGLVEGASRGEGLGNQFLGHIRDVDAILHVVRCFDDPNVVHIRDKPAPRQDIEIIHTELALADLQQLERKIEKLERQTKGDRKLEPVLALARRLTDHLATGQPLTAHPERESETFQTLNAEMNFLTTKPVIYVANVDEATLEADAPQNPYLAEAQAVAAEQRADIITVCAQLEADLTGLSPSERAEYLALAGIQERGLAQVIRQCYDTLGLISYFSFNDEEARAWTIQRGWTAPQAAGVIHSDFERGFIRAEVVPFEVLAQHGSRSAVRAAGAMQTEGRDYVVQDGDVILFHFNV